MKGIRYALAILLAAGLAACGGPQQRPSYDSPTYTPPGTSQQGYGVQYGRVSNIEEVRAGGGGTGTAGAVIGGLVGGLAGHQIGGGRGQTAATIAGAVGGAVVGSQVQKRNQPTDTRYRVTVAMDNGGSQAIEVAAPGDLRVGDRVTVDANGMIRRY